MTALLIVDFLPLSFSDRDLGVLFAKFGTVKSAHIVMTRANQAVGFGYVEMATPEEAEKAFKALDGAEIMGRRIMVQPAVAA